MGLGRLNLSALNNLSVGNPSAYSLFEKQRTYMFNAHITLPFLSIINQFMPIVNQFSDVFTYSIITAELPGKTREFETRRFMNETWTSPKGDDFDHTWDCSIRASEIGFEMDLIRYWFEYSKIVDDLDDAKGSITLELMKLDGQTTNRKFDLFGVYPLSIPGIKALNHDDKTGIVQLDLSFAFDQMKYGPLDGVFSTLSALLNSPI